MRGKFAEISTCTLTPLEPQCNVRVVSNSRVITLEVTMTTFTFVVLVFIPFNSAYHRFQYRPRNNQCVCVSADLCADEDVAVSGHGLLNPRFHNRCSTPGEICCDSLSNSAEVASPRPSRPPCGYSARNFKSRITSGTLTAFGELPWNLIIQETGGDSGKNIYKCGASLIHPKVALTAAHCVTPYSEEPEKILVRAGEWNVDSKDEPFPLQDNSVEEILIYYNYNSLSLKNDIAILILAEEFELRENVGIICLSTAREKIIENSCITSGWGKDAHQKGRYSSTLKKVKVPIVPREFCVKNLRTTRLGPRYSLHKSFICAGGKKNEDSCKGDGGSPLICPLLENRERFVQLGIVSWGIGCGSEGIPGVYVNVPLYLEWIEGEMGERELDTSYFKI